MSLKKKPQGKKKETARHSGGRVGIIHFASTVEEAVTPLTNESFSKITKTAQKRLTFADAKQKLPEISGNIPAEFDATALHVCPCKLICHFIFVWLRSHILVTCSYFTCNLRYILCNIQMEICILTVLL